MEGIFDPCFTTKKVGECMGLGLSMVQRIVKTHGGEITGHSEPGEGTTFEVFFPGMEKPARIRTRTREALCAGAERIVFVDD
jgi:signal transduction histidine kinase